MKMASLLCELFLVSNLAHVCITSQYVDFRSSFNFTDNDDLFDFGRLRSAPAIAFKVPLSHAGTGFSDSADNAKNDKLSKKANKLKFDNDNDSRLFPAESEKLSRKSLLSKVLYFSNVNGTDVYGLDSQVVKVLGQDYSLNLTTSVSPIQESRTITTPRPTTITPRKFIRFWNRNLKTTTMPPLRTVLPLLRPSRTIFPSVKSAPNRIKGKPLIMCMPDGIMFSAQTHYPFYGRVYTRKFSNISDDGQCSYPMDDGRKQMNVSFLYEKCGVPLSSVKAGDANYLVDIVVDFQQENMTQNFVMKCVSQQLHYTTVPSLAVESATPELNMTLSKINAWAEMPACQMRVVQEEEDPQHGHHHDGVKGYEPSNGTTVRNAYIGQMLKMEFSLNPPSKAFGFLIKNCTVYDRTTDSRYVILDSKGCSVDINILGHPHYDTYQDLALVHWHAFRIPEDATLSFQCQCVICSDIKDDNNQNSCEILPTPPICPEMVTSPQLQQFNMLEQQNQVEEATTIKSFVHKKRSVRETSVRTSICLSDQENCDGNSTHKISQWELSESVDSNSEEWLADYCFSPVLLTSVFSLNLLIFLVTSISNAILSMRRNSTLSSTTTRKSSNGIKISGVTVSRSQQKIC